MSLLFFFFFFKQKSAYELLISDWSSDVCSSDLAKQRQKSRHLRSSDHHVRDAFVHGGLPVLPRWGGRRRPIDHFTSCVTVLRGCVLGVQIGRASGRERGCQYV